MNKLKVMVVTTSRADYGILFPLLKKIKSDDYFKLQLVASGSHLSKKLGYSIEEIKKDGFEITECVNINTHNDKEKSVCKSISKGIEGFTDVFEKHSPSMVIVLGDRHELMTICIPAVIYKIPIVHIHGGEVTKGAVDDSIRHSITKMASVHFPSIDIYAKRIVQMGENPEYVYAVGALGIDNIINAEPYNVVELEKVTGVNFNEGVALMTYHPVTLDNYLEAPKQVNQVLKALSATELTVIATMPNADTAGLRIFEVISEYSRKYPCKFKIIKNMGSRAYISAMRYAKVMVGNSSSGIIESASFKLPVVNVGDRQAGRLRAENVIDCPCESQEILKSIKIALSAEFNQSISNIQNPYGDGKTADRICSLLKKIDFSAREKLIKKGFYDLKIDKGDYYGTLESTNRDHGKQQGKWYSSKADRSF